MSDDDVTEPLRKLFDEVGEYAFDARDELDGTVVAVGKVYELVEKAYKAGIAAPSLANPHDPMLEVAKPFLFGKQPPPEQEQVHLMTWNGEPICGREMRAWHSTDNTWDVTCPKCASEILLRGPLRPG